MLNPPDPAADTCLHQVICGLFALSADAVHATRAAVGEGVVPGGGDMGGMMQFSQSMNTSPIALMNSAH